jgi:hypothetical protein
MKPYNVDLFKTVRFAIQGISANSPEEAARAANVLQLPDLFHNGMVAHSLASVCPNHKISDVRVQDLDAHYYAVYPAIVVDGEDANDYNNETHLAGDFVTLLPGEEPQDRFKVMIKNLLGQITLVADKTIGFNQESLTLLNEVAREVGHPMFEFMEKGDGAEVDGYPRENCPPHLDYAEWVHPLMKADFEAPLK